jgi:pimeloyl-ACP methyl ester carboxylesterase
LQDIYDSHHTTGQKWIWVIYGKKDSWLHPRRVESLIRTPFKEHDEPVDDEVISIKNAGHCPHDERPEEVVPILLNVLKTCNSATVTE